MNKGWLLAAALVFGFAAPAMAHGTEACEEEGCLVGKDAPEIQTKEWIGSDGRTTLADFKGEAVLIEAWATW